MDTTNTNANTNTSPQPPPPEIVKKVEKDIAKEAKAEEARVKQAMKDLDNKEKAEAKAEKAVHKAEKDLSKAEKKEMSATKAANKAIHGHDIAVTKLHSAEQDAQTKKQQEVKLLKDLQAKKAQVEAAVKEQQVHNRMRDAKLAEVHGQPTAEAAVGGGVNIG